MKIWEKWFWMVVAYLAAIGLAHLLGTPFGLPYGITLLFGLSGPLLVAPQLFEHLQ